MVRAILEAVEEQENQKGQFSEPSGLYFHGFRNLVNMLSALRKGRFGRPKFTSIGTPHSRGVPYVNQIWFHPKELKLYPVMYGDGDLVVLKKRAARELGLRDWLDAQVLPRQYEKEQEWYTLSHVPLSDIEIVSVVYRAKDPQVEELLQFCRAQGYDCRSFPEVPTEAVSEQSEKPAGRLTTHGSALDVGLHVNKEPVGLRIA